jgi:hypothetical protein
MPTLWWTKHTIVCRLRDSSTSSRRWSAGPQAAHKTTRASRWLSPIVQGAYRGASRAESDRQQYPIGYCRRFSAGRQRALIRQKCCRNAAQRRGGSMAHSGGGRCPHTWCHANDCDSVGRKSDGLNRSVNLPGHGTPTSQRALAARARRFRWEQTIPRLPSRVRLRLQLCGTRVLKL